MPARRQEGTSRTTDTTVAGAVHGGDGAEWDEALARRIRGAGLTTPALLWLGSLRPLWFLGGQVLRLADPFWSVLRDDDAVNRLADLLEDPRRCERFLDRLAASEEMP